MTVKQIDESTWIFDEGGVRFFLLCGTEKALLIDSGMQTKNAKELARELTDLPISLLNTHADPDHTGSNEEFDTFYMSPAECSNYYRSQGRSGSFIPIWDWDILELGERTLRIIALPGHTPGSIAVLDEKNGRLFSGDPIQDGKIFMFGPQREMHAYVKSLERLLKYTKMFSEIFPSHGTCPVKPAMIEELCDAAQKILDGRAEKSDGDMFGHPIHVYDMGVATFLCDAE